MPVVKRLCCQTCGADLDVPEGIRFLTCNYCHSKLEVVEDTSVTHTRLLEKVAQHTGKMVDNLRIIELQNELERLDREWEIQRESYVIQGKYGHRSMPSMTSSVVGGIFGIIVGITWMAITSNASAPAFFPLFGLLFIGFGIYSLVGGTSRAKNYQNDTHAYEMRRHQLLRKIESQRDQD